MVLLYLTSRPVGEPELTLGPKVLYPRGCLQAWLSLTPPFPWTRLYFLPQYKMLQGNLITPCQSPTDHFSMVAELCKLKINYLKSRKPMFLRHITVGCTVLLGPSSSISHITRSHQLCVRSPFRFFSLVFSLVDPEDWLGPVVLLLSAFKKQESLLSRRINIDVVTCSPSELHCNFLDVLSGILWFSKVFLKTSYQTRKKLMILFLSENTIFNKFILPKRKLESESGNVSY